MGDIEDTCASLRAQIAATEAQLAGLKRELESAEQAAIKARAQDAPNLTATTSTQGSETRRWPLLDEEYRRYGRQMIVPQVGLQGEWISSSSQRKSLEVQLLTTILQYYRSTETSICKGFDCRSGRLGMSGCAVSRRSWGGHTGTRGWGYSGIFEPSSAGFTSEQECGKVQGR